LKNPTLSAYATIAFILDSCYTANKNRERAARIVKIDAAINIQEHDEVRAAVIVGYGSVVLQQPALRLARCHPTNAARTATTKKFLNKQTC
jgi:hypothetical protein